MNRILMGMAGAMLALVVIDTAQAGDWGYGHHRGYTGHYDYVPAHYDRHRLHADYVPGHYDYHRGSHGGYYSPPGYYVAPPAYSSPRYYAAPSYPVVPGYRQPRSHCDY